MEDVTANVMAVVKQMMDRGDDGGWNEILQLFLCTGDSIRLPIYQTFPDEPVFEIDDAESDTTPSKKKRKLTTGGHTTELQKKLDQLLTVSEEV